MPTIGFDRRKWEDKRPHTYKELREGALKKMLPGGLLKKGNCEIDDDYINGWFDTEGRDLLKKHQKHRLQNY